MSISDVARTAVNNVAQHVASVSSEAKAQAQANSQVSNKSAKDSVENDTSSANPSDSVDFSETAEKMTEEAKSYKSEEKALNAAMDEDGVYGKATNINGTDGNDTIDITCNNDGSYTVVVNGEKQSYTAEEAQRLAVDGGKGNDTISIHQDGYQNGTYKDENGIEHKTGLMIKGGDGDDVIKADEDVYRNLYISGGKGKDNIVGGSGNDHIVDNYGSNTIDGGAGNDSITALGYGNKGSWYGRLWNKLSGSNQDNIIEGGQGNDTIITGNGNDTITDKGGNNTIISNGGNDSIEITDSSASSHNSIYSGDGNDTIKTGDSNDTIYGGKGNDVIESTGGENFLHGGDGNDTIHGGKGNDFIDSTGGENSLYGGDGNDTIHGGKGRDYIEGGKGNDVIYGGNDGDVIYGGKGNDTIYGQKGDDFINAGEGDDIVYGNEGKDTIFGLAGDDKLYGGDGADVIASGKGNDLVDGGDGADTIRYTQGLFTGDKVNSDSKDDVKILNPIDVPSNFTMDKTTPEWFQDNMRDNLEAFACIEPGQELLKGIADTGHNVRFSYTNDANGYTAQRGDGGIADITYNDNGTRTWTAGGGCDSTVKINPEFITLCNGSQRWSDCNTMVIMAHEMCHAYNNATGTKDYSFYNSDTAQPDGPFKKDPRDVRGAELQAVGYGDDSVISANPYGMSENDYRDYFNMDKRTSYMPQ